MAAAAMAHANPVVRGGGEDGPGPSPAARSRAWGLRTPRRGLAAPPAREGGDGAGEIASPFPGSAGGGAALRRRREGPWEPPAFPWRGRHRGDFERHWFCLVWFFC